MSSSHRLSLAAGLLFVLLLVGCGNQHDWNVVIVTFDTTRADRIGCYGNEDIQTPHLDALAASGARFEHAYTPVPITAPSHSSIFTGKYPLAHGFRDNGLFTLGEGQQTLAEILKARGYATAAAIGSYPLLSRFGLNQGFDLYDDKLTTEFENLRGEQILPRSRIFFDERPASRVNEALFPWLENHFAGADADQPFFIWAHYFDPHQPLEPPPPYDQLYPDAYNGEIAYSDEAFGRLMARIEELGAADRTLVVFASDHGEGLDEHGETTHSLLAYDSTLRVPLIIQAPNGQRNVVVNERVSTIDIMPTVLDLLGLEIPPEVQGISLAPAIRNGIEPPARQLYAETLAPRLGQGWGELRALYEQDHKLVFGPRPELYDVTHDPRELNNLIDEESELAKRMQHKLSRFLTEHAVDDPTATVGMDEETRQRLMALGYINAGGDAPTQIEEVLRRDGQAPQDRVGDIGEFTYAKQFMLDQKFLAALETAENLVERDPNNPAYLEIQIAAEIALGRLDEAAGRIGQLQGLRLGSGLLGPIMRDLGGAFFRRGETSRALEYLRQSHDHKPTAAGHFLESQILGSLSRRDEELKALQAALVLNEKYVPARVSLAVRQAQSGQRDLAEQNFRRAIQEEPYFPRGHFNFGAFLLEDHDTESAIAHFHRAAELDPNYWQAHRALISVYLALDQRSKAEEQLAVLSRRAPEGELKRARQLLEISE